MEMKQLIEAAELKVQGRKPLAIALGLNPQQLTDAKAGRSGLSNYACAKLAEILDMDKFAVIAASELATEKRPERRAFFAPFAKRAADVARTAALSTVILFVTPNSPEAEPVKDSQGNAIGIM